MGGADWSALPLACEMYDVSDVEGLIDRILVIKAHKPPPDDTAADKD